MNNLNKLFQFLNILQIYNSFLTKKENLSDCENYFFCRKKAEIFNLFPKKMYLCRLKISVMATITLEYDTKNKAIKKLIDAILLLGAQKIDVDEKNDELTETEEKEAFLYNSKIFASRIFSKHLEE